MGTAKQIPLYKIKNARTKSGIDFNPDYALEMRKR
jgi:hypothetical protein